MNNSNITFWANLEKPFVARFLRKWKYRIFDPIIIIKHQRHSRSCSYSQNFAPIFYPKRALIAKQLTLFYWYRFQFFCWISRQLLMRIYTTSLSGTFFDTFYCCCYSIPGEQYTLQWQHCENAAAFDAAVSNCALYIYCIVLQCALHNTLMCIEHWMPVQWWWSAHNARLWRSRGFNVASVVVVVAIWPVSFPRS